MDLLITETVLVCENFVEIKIDCCNQVKHILRYNVFKNEFYFGNVGHRFSVSIMISHVDMRRFLCFLEKRENFLAISFFFDSHIG